MENLKIGIASRNPSLKRPSVPDMAKGHRREARRPAQKAQNRRNPEKTFFCKWKRSRELGFILGKG